MFIIFLFSRKKKNLPHENITFRQQNTSNLLEFEKNVSLWAGVGVLNNFQEGPLLAIDAPLPKLNVLKRNKITLFVLNYSWKIALVVLTFFHSAESYEVQNKQ